LHRSGAPDAADGQDLVVRNPVADAERISLTGRLLREAPERPVAEIARACGFESLATFYRVFHNAVGMPPGEFRAQSTPSGPAGLLLGGERGSANLTGE